MHKFGQKSRDNLSQCHPDLQLLFNVVVREYDCSVLVGHRSEAEQKKAFDSGRSKLEFPDSKHNCFPSLAVDVAPYPIKWGDEKRFSNFAGYVRAKAEMLGIKIRWGGDWDSDTETTDQTFNDLPHFELIIEKGEK